MSLLLEALKKAEKAKEDAQRQSGKSASGEAGLQLEIEPASDAKHVFTKDELPSISSGVDITSEDLGTAPPPPPPPAPARAAAESAPPARPTRPATAAPEPAPEARAAAKKVFEAKFKEPNPKLPFYIVMGLLSAFAVGTVGYFWYQLRPPPPLVNPNPPRNASEPVAGASEAAPPAGAPAKPAAVAPAPEIPGLPQSKDPATAAPGSASPAPAAPAATSAPTPPLEPAGKGTAAPAAGAMAPARGTTQAAPTAAVPTPAAPTPAAAPRPAPTPATAPARGERAPVATRKPAPAIDPDVETAYQAYQAGDLATARSSYSRALAKDPGNRDALLGLAAVETRSQNPSAAEALYRRILRADPRDPNAQAGLLSLRPDGADPVATESRIKTLLASEPDSAALQFALGAQYAQQGRWPEAQQAFFKAFAVDPENPDFAYNLAVSLDHLRQPKLALEYYRRALALAERRGASFDRAAAQARTQDLGR